MEPKFKTLVAKSSSNSESQFILGNTAIFMSVIANLKDFQCHVNTFKGSMLW